jgi:hypothetical protein
MKFDFDASLPEVTSRLKKCFDYDIFYVKEEAFKIKWN